MDIEAISMTLKSELIELFISIFNVWYIIGLAILGLSLFISVTPIKVILLLIYIPSVIAIRAYYIPMWKKTILKKR